MTKRVTKSQYDKMVERERQEWLADKRKQDIWTYAALDSLVIAHLLMTKHSDIVWC